ncbi:hypothetical protein ACTMTI_09730 [Nonomuraea sp. H19]
MRSDRTTSFGRVVATEIDVSSGRYSFQTALEKNAVGLAPHPDQPLTMS